LLLKRKTEIQGLIAVLQMHGTISLCHTQEKRAILLLRFKKLVCEATRQIQHTLINHHCNRNYGFHINSTSDTIKLRGHLLQMCTDTCYWFYPRISLGLAELNVNEKTLPSTDRRQTELVVLVK